MPSFNSDQNSIERALLGRTNSSTDSSSFQTTSKSIIESTPQTTNPAADPARIPSFGISARRIAVAAREQIALARSSKHAPVIDNRPAQSGAGSAALGGGLPALPPILCALGRHYPPRSAFGEVRWDVPFLLPILLQRVESVLRYKDGLLHLDNDTAVAIRIAKEDLVPLQKLIGLSNLSTLRAIRSSALASGSEEPMVWADFDDDVPQDHAPAPAGPKKDPLTDGKSKLWDPPWSPWGDDEGSPKGGDRKPWDSGWSPWGEDEAPPKGGDTKPWDPGWSPWGEDEVPPRKKWWEEPPPQWPPKGEEDGNKRWWEEPPAPWPPPRDPDPIPLAGDSTGGGTSAAGPTSSSWNPLKSTWYGWSWHLDKQQVSDLANSMEVAGGAVTLASIMSVIGAPAAVLGVLVMMSSKVLELCDRCNGVDILIFQSIPPTWCPVPH